MPTVDEILSQTEHRPWEKPPGRGVGRMTWHDLLFAHWPIEAERLRPLIPPSLTLETFDDSAWLGVVPFGMSGVRPHWFPDFPPLTSFLELNVRTYVTAGGKPGVWFFSLDAASRLAVRAARLGFHLPYFDAKMELAIEGDLRRYRSRRTHRGAEPATFEASYRPTGEPYSSEPGSLEHWLTERYCLYSEKSGTLYRGDIHHLPWPLQPAELETQANTMGEQIGVEFAEPPRLLHFARTIDVIAWSISPA